jgi:outer membrane protein OmpA-like peptidoglycan-associated protein
MMRDQLAMLGLCLGIVAAGCAGTNKVIAPMPTPTHTSTPQVIQQMGYGINARFTRCESTTCPARTVKTLAQVERAPAVPVIARAPAPPRVQEIRKLIVVPFKSGSARLGKQEAKVIDMQSADAKRSRRIVISGRTDNTGSPRRNDILARQRAEAVRDYLVPRRLNDTVEIALESKGSCCYAADNRSASGRAANRRAEVEMFIVSP